MNKSSDDTLYDRFLKAAKNCRLWIIVLIILTLITGVSALLKNLSEIPDSVTKIIQALGVKKIVPAALVVDAITIARKHWSSLRYVYIHNPNTENPPPDYIFYQLYIGGSEKTTVQRLSLKPWTDKDFAGLDRNVSHQEFVNYVVQRYR